jgi:serine/threonine protein kinase
MSESYIQNKYEIKQCIGQGKFGKVFLGKNIYNGAPVAIKIETKAVSLLKREATILRYLQDNGVKSRVPSLLWFGVLNEEAVKEEHKPCMVMSYCSGGSLNAMSNKNMGQCISVVEAIHTRSVIHRDIKPQNFMFDARGNIQLIDFGLAAFMDDDAEVKVVRDTLFGTPRYASPHIHLGIMHTYRDDLISLGYVYLHLTTYGEYPRRPNSIAAAAASPLPQESIHHPIHLEAARGKQLNNLRGGCGKPIFDYLEYCYNLGGKSRIDYTYLRLLFQAP